LEYTINLEIFYPHADAAGMMLHIGHLTGRHDIAEILLKVALNTKNKIKIKSSLDNFKCPICNIIPAASACAGFNEVRVARSFIFCVMFY
jgi:hypothetical protein